MKTSSFEALSIKPLNHEKGRANTNILKGRFSLRLGGAILWPGGARFPGKAKALNAQAEPASSGQGRAVNSSFLGLYPLLYFLVAFGSC